MANVRQYLQDILNAIYGEEVRGSIHDAIEAMNEESTNAEAVAISSRDSAKHNAEVASASATAAAASETAAKTSETNAKASETAAKASETAAKASETAAKASENNASDSADAAYESEQNAKSSENAAKDSEDAAAASASASRTYSMQAFEYKHDAQESAEAAHQYELQCEQIRDDIGYPIDPKGTIAFANLPSISSAQIGWMYNISDDFTTTSDFEEGAGKFYSAGSEVYLNSNNKWSVMAGPGVTGIKGEAESNYRKGQINITKSMLGINTLDDIDTPTFSQATTRSNIENTDSVSTIFGKIKKFFADLKTVAFTGSYNDLLNKPEHLGHSIKDVTTTFTDRAGLKFTGNVSISDDSTNDETIIDVEGKPDHFYATKEDMLDDIANIGEGEMAYIEEESSDLLNRVENIEQDVTDAKEDIAQLNNNLSVQDLTSQLEYRYCRSADTRNRLLRIGNLMIYHICLITTSQVTNNTMDFVKIPSNLLPSTNAMTVAWTNNNEANYAKYSLPVTVRPNNEYNLNIDYTSLGGSLSSSSWLWGTVIWTIGH